MASWFRRMAQDLPRTIASMAPMQPQQGLWGGVANAGRELAGRTAPTAMRKPPKALNEGALFQPPVSEGQPPGGGGRAPRMPRMLGPGQGSDRMMRMPVQPPGAGGRMPASEPAPRGGSNWMDALQAVGGGLRAGADLPATKVAPSQDPGNATEAPQQWGGDLRRMLGGTPAPGGPQFNAPPPNPSGNIYDALVGAGGQWGGGPRPLPPPPSGGGEGQFNAPPPNPSGNFNALPPNPSGNIYDALIGAGGQWGGGPRPLPPLPSGGGEGLYAAGPAPIGPGQMGASGPPVIPPGPGGWMPPQGPPVPLRGMVPYGGPSGWNSGFPMAYGAAVGAGQPQAVVGPNGRPMVLPPRPQEELMAGGGGMSSYG